MWAMNLIMATTILCQMNSNAFVRPNMRQLDADTAIRRHAAYKEVWKYLKASEDIKFVEQSIKKADTEDSKRFLESVVNMWFYRDLFGDKMDKHKPTILEYEHWLRENKIDRIEFLQKMILL